MTDLNQIVARLSDAQRPRQSRTVYSVGEAIKWQSERLRLCCRLLSHEGNTQ